MNRHGAPRAPWPRPATALRETLAEGYTAAAFRRDLLAGAVVGIVALPLSMALAIASGVPPAHGLYTAIVAGGLIPLLGGSRVQVSGPTAAFVVILAPVSQRFGVGGLLLATLMAGAILFAMGVMRLGRFIEFVPYPVTTGFTAGIAVVIATLQVKDLLGLTVKEMPEHFVERVQALALALDTFRWPDVAIGALTLTILVLWPRLTRKVPAPLVALVVGAGAAVLAARFFDFDAATIATRFTYRVRSALGHGIPSLPPLPVLLFMQRMAEVSEIRLVDQHPILLDRPLPKGVIVYEIAGPLFFGAAQKAMAALQGVDEGVRVVLLDLRSVPALDATGLVGLESAFERLNRAGVLVVIGGAQPQPLRTMARAGWTDRKGRLAVYRSFEHAVEEVRKAFE